MVNEERVRHMIKMASFDTYDGKDCKPMMEYSRRDYISMQMMQSLISGTIAFALLFGMGIICQMENLMEKITASNLLVVLPACVLAYLGFLLIYEMVTYLVAQKRYTEGRKKVKQFYSHLRKINLMYEREERLKMSANTERTKTYNTGTR